MTSHYTNLYTPVGPPPPLQPTAAPDPCSEQRERVRASTGMIPLDSTSKTNESSVTAPEGPKPITPRSGRPRHEIHEMKAEIEKWFRENPKSTLADARKLLKDKFDVETSMATISRIVKAANIVHLREKYKHDQTKPRKKRTFKKQGITKARAAEAIERVLTAPLPREEALPAVTTIATTTTTEGERDYANCIPRGNFVPPYASPAQALLVDELRRELIEAKERIALLETQMKLVIRASQGRALGGVISKSKSMLAQAQQEQTRRLPKRQQGVSRGGEVNRLIEFSEDRWMVEADANGRMETSDD